MGQLAVAGAVEGLATLSGGRINFLVGNSSGLLWRSRWPIDRSFSWLMSQPVSSIQPADSLFLIVYAKSIIDLAQPS